MAIRTVPAHPEIARRLGLGTEQCIGCGYAYAAGRQIPDYCVVPGCPQAEGGYLAAHSEQRLTKRYHLTEQQGKLVQRALQGNIAVLRHVGQEVFEDYSARIEELEELAKLFD